MTLKFFSNLRNFDWILFGAVVLLLCFGLSALYSIAISSDQPDFSNFRKQIIFALIGLLLLFLLTFLDYRIWQNYSYFLYGGVVVLLVAVLVFGRTIRGTTGWFSIAGINFQPVELAKISLIASLAWLLSQRPQIIRELKYFLLAGLGVAIMFSLVV